MTASIIYYVALVVTIVICRGRAFGRFTSLAVLVMLTGVVQLVLVLIYQSQQYVNLNSSFLLLQCIFSRDCLNNALYVMYRPFRTFPASP